MENRAAEIRAGLKHPVIDGDGHWMEPIPVFLEYLREVGGAEVVDQIRALWRRKRRLVPGHAGRNASTTALRRAIWWGVTSNTLDKATALLPALLNERLPELGIDFALIYPSFGLTINGIAQDDLHRAAARAYNMMTADMFAPFAARFAPVAIMPARTPDEAIEELEYAVGKLGYKAIMLRGNQERPIPSAAEGIDPQKAAWYCDTIALDSPYDYEPFWQRCVDLGVAVTQHSGSPRWQDRASISNFTYNHVGHFAESNHAFARGVFLGGLVRRYPSLNFGFMEGGVSWACQMCVDMIEHWEKRRRAGLQYPSATDVAELHQLIDRYGDQRLKANADAIMNNLDVFRPECSLEELGRPEHVVGRFRGGRNQLERGRPGSLLRQLLLRLRGGRPRNDVGLRSAHGRPAAAGLQLRLHAFRRARFQGGDSRSVRDGGEGLRDGAGFPRVHVHQRRASAHAQQPGLLQGHRRRAGGGR